MMMMDYGFIPAPQPYTSGLVLPTQWGSVLVCLLHHFRTMSYCMYAVCCFEWQAKVFFTVIVGSSWKLWTTLKAWLSIKRLLLGYSYDAFTRGWKHMNPVCQRDKSLIFKSACLVCAKLPGIILSVSCSPLNVAQELLCGTPPDSPWAYLSCHSSRTVLDVCHIRVEQCCGSSFESCLKDLLMGLSSLPICSLMR